MDLYIDPAATTSRAVLAFCHAAELAPVIRPVALMRGEHHLGPFAAMNPNCMVPVLVDGDLVLTEAAAILTHLARTIDSPLYPATLVERARVDERIGWFGTNFYKDFGYQFVYPQILPQHRRATDEATHATIEWGREQSRRWLAVLEKWIGPERRHLVGERLTIADYYGASIASLGELIGSAFAGYPNTQRWYAEITNDRSWRAINGAFLGFAEAIRIRGHSFVTL